MSKKRIILWRSCALLLILTGTFMALAWHFYLMPQLQTNSPMVRLQYWQAVQQRIKRFGWKHDDFAVVGRYGKKEWADWIIDQGKSGTDLYGCGDDGHKAEALQKICNWKPEKDSANEWINWWEINQNKSQEEWLQAGFLQYGLSLSIPPNSKDNQLLLALLGSDQKNEDGVEKVAGFIKYNAFRWLRDTGFDPVDFVLESENKLISENIIRGLKKYQKQNAATPFSDEVGLLFREDGTLDDGRPRAYILNTSVQRTVNSVMILLIFAGTFLLGMSMRIRCDS